VYASLEDFQYENTTDQKHGERQEITWRHTIVDGFVALPVLVVTD